MREKEVRPARRTALVSLRLLGLLAAAAALAQSSQEGAAAETTAAAADETAAVESADPANGLEEVVGRVEIPRATVRDSAISGVRFDRETLQREGIADVRELANLSPSLQVKSAFAAVNPTLFIRGVGIEDFNANFPSAVTVFQDGIYMRSPAGQLFQVFDVESVEVLRGPHGTRRNVSSGAIVIESKKPIDAFEATTTASYGNYNFREVQAAVNVPLIDEHLAARFSGKWTQRDGITKNRCNELEKTGSAPCADASGQNPLSSSVNDVDNWAARGLLRATLPLPGEQELELLFNAHGGQNLAGSTQYQHVGFQPTTTETSLSRFLLPNRRDVTAYKDTDNDRFAGDYDRQGPRAAGPVRHIAQGRLAHRRRARSHEPHRLRVERPGDAGEY